MDGVPSALFPVCTPMPCFRVCLQCVEMAFCGLAYPRAFAISFPTNHGSPSIVTVLISPNPQTTDGKIALLAQGHVELKAEIDSVKADLEQFKNEMPILGVEESKITAAVKKKGVESICFWKSSGTYRPLV